MKSLIIILIFSLNLQTSNNNKTIELSELLKSHLQYEGSQILILLTGRDVSISKESNWEIDWSNDKCYKSFMLPSNYQIDTPTKLTDYLKENACRRLYQ